MALWQAAADRQIAEMKAEQDRVLTLYKKGKLTEERWEAEDAKYQQVLAEVDAINITAPCYNSQRGLTHG